MPLRLCFKPLLTRSHRCSADDPFKCGTDATGQLQIERQLTIELSCDAGGSMSAISNLQATEVRACTPPNCTI